jgi:dTMP kinase
MVTIAIEGADASGKETQTAMLQKHLEEIGLKVLLVSFPRYNTPVGGLIKAALRDDIFLSDEAMHMLLDVDKQDFSSKLKDLEKLDYDVIIYDRYLMSNIVYCMAKGISYNWVKAIQSGITPADYTFILNMPAEVSFKRKHSNYDSSELDKHEKDIGLLKKVETIYNVLYLKSKDINNNMGTVFLIDADNARERVHGDIVELVEEVIYSE